MWWKIVLTIAKISLQLLAPKASGTIKTISTIANIALPIVEAVSKSGLGNETKFDMAVGKVAQQLAETSVIADDDVKEHVIESGVQLAYSLFRAKTGD
jgi:hypothetical protein